MGGSARGTSRSGLRRLAFVGALALVAMVPAAPADASKRRDHDLLRIESVRVGTKAAPVAITVAVPHAASLRAWVDGRPARVAFSRVGRTVRVGRLSPHNRLTGGENRIRIQAKLPGGHKDRESATVRLPVNGMIADAGRDPSAIVGEPVTVGTDGNPPGVAEPRAPHWRTVSAPEGSEAELSNPRSLTPKFVPDLPGTYVLRLLLERGGSTASDTVAVTARPPDPPIGVSLETLSGAADGAIRIDGAGVKDTTDRNGVFVAVLERTTRAIVESGTVPRNGGGITQLKSIAAPLGRRRAHRPLPDDRQRAERLERRRRPSLQ